jgi:hypothetical protein
MPCLMQLTSCVVVMTSCDEHSADVLTCVGCVTQDCSTLIRRRAAAAQHDDPVYDGDAQSEQRGAWSSLISLPAVSAVA